MGEKYLYYVISCSCVYHIWLYCPYYVQTVFQATCLDRCSVWFISAWRFLWPVQQVWFFIPELDNFCRLHYLTERGHCHQGLPFPWTSVQGLQQSLGTWYVPNSHMIARTQGSPHCPEHDTASTCILQPSLPQVNGKNIPDYPPSDIKTLFIRTTFFPLFHDIVQMLIFLL